MLRKAFRLLQRSVPLRWGRACLAQRGSGPSREGRDDFGDLPSLEALARRGLFVVGNARSGTSIFCRCLNYSRDVYLLEECNVHVNHHRPDFHAWFNRMHRELGNLPSKGTYVPSPPVPLEGGLPYLRWLSRHHKYVGEKVAFVPLGTYGGRPFQDVFFEFHSQFFYEAKHFLIVRTPAECTWSMQKLFPQAELAMVVESWLRSLAVCLDLYATFPHCWMVFFDRLSRETIAGISQILEVEIPVPARALTERRQSSRLARGEIPKSLKPFADTVAACTEVYEELETIFSAETLRYQLDEDLVERLQPLRTQIDSLLAGLAEACMTIPMPRNAGSTAEKGADSSDRLERRPSIRSRMAS